MLLGTGIALTHRSCELLKKDREMLEDIASDEYGIPRTGVSPQHPVHFIGHLATRALPSLAIGIWATALMLTYGGVLCGTAGGSADCPKLEAAVQKEEPGVQVPNKKGNLMTRGSLKGRGMLAVEGGSSDLTTIRSSTPLSPSAPAHPGVPLGDAVLPLHQQRERMCFSACLDSAHGWFRM